MTLLLLLLAGCIRTQIAPDTDHDPPDPTETGDSQRDSHDPDSGDSTPTVETGDTGTPSYDCDDLPGPDLSGQIMDWARGYHDVEFDTEGHLVGMDTQGGLVKATYDGDRQLWVPGIWGVEGMDRMADGSIVYGSWGSVSKVSPDGATEVLVPNAGDVHGVTVGPDGNVYYANSGVYRYDVETGERVELVQRNPQQGHRHVVFSLDSTQLYIATLAIGDVWVLDLDENLDAVGEPEIFARNVGGGWHDGIGIDACGNLYVAEYYSMGLYRITPDAQVQTLGQQPDWPNYGHGLDWGSGLGGWKATSLYLPLPYNGNKVKEADIEVPSGDLVRTWNGVLVQ